MAGSARSWTRLARATTAVAVFLTLAGLAVPAASADAKDPSAGAPAPTADPDVEPGPGPVRPAGGSPTLVQRATDADPDSLGAIPDGGDDSVPSYGAPKDVTFTVSGVSQALTGVTVSFKVGHTWVGDLEVTLFGPGGESFLLFARTGAIVAGSGGYSSDLLATRTYTFTDSASVNWWTAAAMNQVASGVYRTTESGGAGQTIPAPVTMMNPAFAGAVADGTWTLRFRDGYRLDVGTVTAATLILHTAGTSTSDAADFDGDDDSAPAVWRPSTGGWYADGVPTAFFGLDGDIPVPADWDGDGTTDRAVFRPSTGAWLIDLPGIQPRYLGLAGDVPVPADWDGDGGVDRAVWRPSTGGWFVDLPGVPVSYYGLAGDIPVPARWDGDGDADRAVFRPIVGGWYTDLPAAPPVFYGLDGDVPIPYHYASPAYPVLWRPSTGAWFAFFAGGTPVAYWGLDGDVPVPADYPGSDLMTIEVHRPSSGAWIDGEVAPGATTYLGAPGDVQLVLPHHLALALGS